MLKAVSARRGMPFEWSFLLDALQTERDQGITIDTTQIRFRTRSRDVVLIDAPGHAEFLRNMITGASQADAAVLIIDALEGVRDQTRRHGYLLHLLGVKQVAVVVNKMDRVDFSAERFNAISDEISAHLTGLGVTPTAVIPISARDGDGVAERTPRIEWYSGPTVVEALDALEPARPLDELALRLPVQAIYKFDDRRIVAGRIESGSIAAGDEIVIMPAGKIAKIRSVESWPATRCRVRREPAARSASRSTANCSSSAAMSSPMSVGPARHPEDSRAHILAARQPLRSGATILVRLGTRETRAIVVAIEKAVDPGELSAPKPRRSRAIMSAKSTFRWRSRSPPTPIPTIRDRAPRDRGQRPHRRRRPGAHGRRRTARGSGRHRAGGIRAAARRALRALPPRRRRGLADRVAGLRQIRWRARWSAAVRARRLAGAARRRHASRRIERRFGFAPQDRSENIRRLAEVAAHLARNGQIAIVAAVSPSAEDRALARRVADPMFREVFIATPAEVCESRDPKGHYAKARAGTLKGFTGIGADYEAPRDAELTLRHLQPPACGIGR